MAGVMETNTINLWNGDGQNYVTQLSPLLVPQLLQPIEVSQPHTAVGRNNLQTQMAYGQSPFKMSLFYCLQLHCIDSQH